MDLTLFRQMADGEERHWWFVARREIVGRLVEALPLPEGARVVDAGCGTGANAAFLAARGEGRYRVLGIDPTAPAIDLAHRFSLPGLEFRCGTLSDLLGEGEAAADLVLMLDVIEHVEDDRSLVEQAVRLLGPGGHLLVTVPADPRLWSPHDEVFGHYRRYEPHTLREVLRGLPLEILVLSPFNARLYPLIRTVRAVKRARARGREVAAEEGSDFAEYPVRVDAALRRLFAGEAGRLLGVLRGSGRPYRFGASLLLVARKGTG